jgi:hypothetical protein
MLTVQTLPVILARLANCAFVDYSLSGPLRQQARAAEIGQLDAAMDKAARLG